LSVAGLNPRRIGLGALAIVSIVASPALVVYEFFLGIVLAVANLVTRRVRPSHLVGRNVGAIGMALLAGPVAYAIAWALAEWFNL